jgi:type IV pilus assembly protein PilB
MENSRDNAGNAALLTAAMSENGTRHDGQPKLGEVLVAAGVLSQVQLLEALTEQARDPKRRRLGEILLQGGVITEAQLTRALSGQLRVSYIDLPGMGLGYEIVHLIPRALAERHDVIAVDITPEGGLLLAMADPTDVVARDDIRTVTGRPVKPACARPSHVRQAISRYYRFSEPSMTAASTAARERERDREREQREREPQARPESTPLPSFLESVAQAGPLTEDEARPELPVADPAPPRQEFRNPLLVPQDPMPTQTANPVDVVDVIFEDAVRAGASDIHVEPRAHGVDVRFRIDGLLREVLSVPKHLQAPLISRMKVLASLDIAERRRPQDGRITLDLKHNSSIDARVSTMPTLHGEKIVIRLLDASRAIFSLDQLGFDAADRALAERSVSRPQGLVLVCGPTGSGKTSTLYALLKTLQRPETNIVTIEDPIEYQMPGINQVQVDDRAGVTFAKALRTVLRQDPDVVMVGEIRDADTAEIAFQAALTGHLVLSTVHTNDAPSTITRLVDMGVEPFLIASSLEIVIAQRLVRRICHACAVPADVSPKIIATLGIGPIEAARLMRGEGCAECHYSGYQGRVAVHQMMPITDILREQIITQVSERTVAHASEAAGVRSLQQAGVELAISGVTTAEEVVRVLQTVERTRLTCPSCEAEVRSEFVTCPFCNQDLSGDACRNCGKELAPGWTTCPFCSAAVGAVSMSGKGKPATSMSGGGPDSDPEDDDGPPRVLVVEDDDDVRGVLEVMLEDEGYKVVGARDGDEALRRSLTHRPNLVLLDIMLPDRSGIEICRELRSHPQTSLVPIVFLTARSDLQTELAGFDAGADDYLLKPIDRDRLLARIAKRIRTSALA